MAEHGRNGWKWLEIIKMDENNNEYAGETNAMALSEF